jgi:hypothetical protein
MKDKVYIASPYTSGDKLRMVRLQIDAWHILKDFGYIPIAPLLTHYMNEVRKRSYSEWLEYDFEILKMCQCLIRLKPADDLGNEIPSMGADREEDEAKRLGIPCLSFSTLEDLKRYLESSI